MNSLRHIGTQLSDSVVTGENGVLGTPLGATAQLSDSVVTGENGVLGTPLAATGLQPVSYIFKKLFSRATFVSHIYTLCLYLEPLKIITLQS